MVGSSWLDDSAKREEYIISRVNRESKLTVMMIQRAITLLGCLFLLLGRKEIIRPSTRKIELKMPPTETAYCLFNRANISGLGIPDRKE